MPLGVWALGIHSLPAAAPGSRLWVQLKGCLPVWVSTNDCEVVGDFAEAVKKEHPRLLADVDHAQIVLSACRKRKDGSGDQLEELRRDLRIEELGTNPDFESNSADNPIVVEVLPPPKGETKSVYILFEDDDLDTSREPTEINEKTFNIYLELYGGFADVSSNHVHYAFDRLENGKTYRMH
ncbi:hypothetical protein HK105_208636 [Polyrhizophydium stewartii]|uniref:Uncharacterized protein n=1 Tax=Polyrhizophydium stewartii TaxID=2732419 RepID=A0ABR4MXE0_9FUNG